MGDARAVLIAAISGRALAASARRAHLRPLVADCFGDQDTLALADNHVTLSSGLERPFDQQEILAVLERLASGDRPIGVVCGTGFEDQPDLLESLAARWRLLGNGAKTVGHIKDPVAFSGLCLAVGVPHPEISVTRPRDPTGWLAKRRGGAGGSHVRRADDPIAAGAIYYQREVAGRPVSALVLAHRGVAKLVGFSEQWSAPDRQHPFRYGGAVQPAELTHGTQAAMVESLARLLARVPLEGLNSADFLVDGDRFWLLEINPRPGGTLDIFEPHEGSLLGLHIAACERPLDDGPTWCGEAAAAAIAYADHDIAVMPAIDWPTWTRDRPRSGITVKAGQPVCTVHAQAVSAAAARLLVAARVSSVLAELKRPRP